MLQHKCCMWVTLWHCKPLHHYCYCYYGTTTHCGTYKSLQDAIFTFDPFVLQFLMPGFVSGNGIVNGSQYSGQLNTELGGDVLPITLFQEKLVLHPLSVSDYRSDL